MAAKEISFKINAQDHTTGVLNKLTSTLNTVAKTVKGQFSGVDKLKTAFMAFSLAVPGLQTVVGAFKKIGAAAKECEQAFSQLEQSEKRLDFAAGLNGKLGETSGALKQFASDLSADLNNSIAGGDILSAMIPVAYDKTSEQLKKITAAGADLAAAADEPQYFE